MAASLTDIIKSLEGRGFDMSMTRGLRGDARRTVGYPSGGRIAGETAKKMFLEPSPQLPYTRDIFGPVPEQYFDPETKLGSGVNQVLRQMAGAGYATGDALVRAPLQAATTVAGMYDDLGRGIGEFAMLPTDRKQKAISDEIDQFTRAQTPRDTVNEMMPPGVSPSQLDDELSSIAASLAQKRIPKQTQAEREQMEDIDRVSLSPEGQADTTDDARARATGELRAMGTDVAPGGIGDAVTTTETDTTEDARARATRAALTKGTDTGGADDAEPYNPYGALLEDAMKQVASLRGEDPNKKTKEQYMQEFAEATGVSIDGKADKSHALMALGLSLMQNKAGRDFNVSNALAAVGEAGEKAMPAFQKAKDQARAERIAAGKYALGEVKAAEAERKSQIASAQQRVTDLMTSTQDYFSKRILAQEKHAHEARMKNADARIKSAEENRKRVEKGQETKGFYSREPEYTGVKIRMGFTDNGNRTVYANPEIDGKDIALRYVSMQRAQNAMDKTDALLAQIQESGIPALEILKGRVSNILVAGGADPEVVFKNKGIGAKDMSVEAEIKTLLNVLILENKRFATQETGNGISNQDRNDLADSFGQIDIFKNPAIARRALREIRTIFGRPLRQIDSELESFMNNQTMYRSENEYGRTMDVINSTLADSPFRPKQTKGEDGVTRYALGDY